MRTEVENIAKSITSDFDMYRSEKQIHPRMFNYYDIVEEYLENYISDIEEEGLKLTKEEKEYIEDSLDFDS